MKLLSHLINPISVIAMFAALCEASATTVLPHLNEESRQIYIWFLIAFPSTLVILFFLTLNFNHQVLYAPHPKTTAASSDPQGQQIQSDDMADACRNTEDRHEDNPR